MQAAKCGLYLDPPEIRFERKRDGKLVLDIEYTDDEVHDNAGSPLEASSIKQGPVEQRSRVTTTTRRLRRRKRTSG